MTGLFENTVSAICHGISDTKSTKASPAVTAFVLRQWQRMPRFLAWPLWLGTIALAFSGIFSGALFHRLSPAQQQAVLERWRFSPFWPLRDLIRFYRSLTIFASCPQKISNLVDECMLVSDL